MIRNADPHADVHLDFVPMVDVLFNLLIFFLLATSLQQAEREMQIALPQSRAAGPMTAALKEIILNVTADGRVIIAGTQVPEDSLAEMLKTAVTSNPAQKVSVRGDRNAPYGHVARVLDICKGAGIAEPYLQTIPTE
jgi:biopolymer transport protein ExbD